MGIKPFRGVSCAQMFKMLKKFSAWWNETSYFDISVKLHSAPANNPTFLHVASAKPQKNIQYCSIHAPGRAYISGRVKLRAHRAFLWFLSSYPFRINRNINVQHIGRGEWNKNVFIFSLVYTFIGCAGLCVCGGVVRGRKSVKSSTVGSFCYVRRRAGTTIARENTRRAKEIRTNRIPYSPVVILFAKIFATRFLFCFGAATTPAFHRQPTL